MPLLIETPFSCLKEMVHISQLTQFHETPVQYDQEKTGCCAYRPGSKNAIDVGSGFKYRRPSLEKHLFLVNHYRPVHRCPTASYRIVSQETFFNPLRDCVMHLICRPFVLDY